MYCHAERGPKGINDTGEFSVAVLCRQELPIEDSISPQPSTCFHAPACANPQQLKCLTVIDEFTGECLAIDVAGSIRCNRVIDVLAKLVSVHGAPRYLRSDYGPEFVSLAVLKWHCSANIDTAHIDPGKPWQNGSNDAFNSTIRDA